MQVPDQVPAELSRFAVQQAFRRGGSKSLVRAMAAEQGGEQDVKATLFAAGYTGYLLFGLFQIAATASGIQHLTGLWWLICWVGAILLGWIPLVGTGLGIYGAHAQWEWSLPASFALFVGVPILLFLPLLTVSVSAAIRRRTGAARARHGTV
jgi:hypothetical protein